MRLFTRLFLMAAMTLLLVATAEVVNGLYLREAWIGDVRADTKQLATIAELEFARVMDGARQMIGMVATLPTQQSWKEQACPLMAAIANSDFEYDHIVIVDINGIIRCSSSGPTLVGTPMPDQDLFNRIVATRKFSIGSYGIGRISHNDVLRVGYPITDNNNYIVGAVYAGINLAWLNTAIAQWRLGNGTTIEIVERNGIVVAQHPESQDIGRPLAGGLLPYLGSETPGLFEQTDSNGTARLYGHSPLIGGGVDGIAVFVGRDKRAAFALVTRSVWFNAVVALLGLIPAGLYLGFRLNRLLTRPFRRLLDTVGRWRDGDWSVRAAINSRVPEFDEISLAFDQMADEVSAREARITRLARYDVLTGLANRAVFVEALERAIAEAQRDNSSFAVLYLDLDHFKDINDTLGHPAGDLLLKNVAERLQSSMREIDTVARFGGDEFAIVLTKITDPADAAVAARRILAMISTPFSIEGNEIHSGTSVGIAVYGSDSPDAESLLSHADVALYRAKSEGRGDFRFFTDTMDAEVRTRVLLETELRTAIAEDQLFLEYQPQVAIDDGQIVGYEALVRWRHPVRGVLSPGVFIGVAERSGLIVALSRWVIREACRQIKTWIDLGVSPPVVAINLSGVEFKSPTQLTDDLETALSQTGVAARNLELELTESVLMEASRQHNDVLVRLREAGFRIAIDDFGTGYSSLDYLRRFPVDRIKVAQNFIKGLTATGGNAAIVRASIGLARDLDLEVIAEGVETAEQARLVASWGCRLAQGYYFSRPVSAEDATALLRSMKVTPHNAELVPASVADDR